MLLDLLEQLVDGCVEFDRQRQDRHRLSFADSVEPVYQLCQHAHEGYLANLREYRAKLGEKDLFVPNVKELCGRLDKDNRFSVAQQAKVISFMRASRRQVTSYTDDDRLIGFITDICSYLSRALTEVCGTQYTGWTLRVMSPVFRNSLAERLGRILAEASLTGDQKQAAATQVLDGIVAELESGFAVVTKREQSLRAAMAA